MDRGCDQCPRARVPELTAERDTYRQHLGDLADAAVKAWRCGCVITHAPRLCRNCQHLKLAIAAAYECLGGA